VLEMLAHVEVPDRERIIQAALAYLRETQRPDGAWFGRWGVNYIYGTWCVISALAALHPHPPERALGKLHQGRLAVLGDRDLDAGMQEAELDAPLAPLDIGRLTPPVASAADPDLIDRLTTALTTAKVPVVLAGRGSRTLEAWQARLALIERIGARVITDLKLGAVFPTDHPLHAGAPGIWLDADANAALRAADVILSLDWVDLGGTLKAAFGALQPPAKIIHASLDHRLHGGWSMD